MKLEICIAPRWVCRQAGGSRKKHEIKPTCRMPVALLNWVNMWLADNVPADDDDSELPPHDSVSDVEMTVSRTSSSFGSGRE